MKGRVAYGLVSLLVALAAGRAAAQDIYRGTLDGSQPIAVNVDNGGGAGKAFITVQYFGESQRATDDGASGDSMKFEYFQLAQGERRTLNPRVPRKTHLMFLQVNTPPIGSGGVFIEVVQGASAYQVGPYYGGSILFDVSWP